MNNFFSNFRKMSTPEAMSKCSNKEEIGMFHFTKRRKKNINPLPTTVLLCFISSFKYYERGDITNTPHSQCCI